MSETYSEFFYGGRGRQIFIFSAQSKALREFEGMLPRKFLENSDAAMAILVLFEEFLRQILFNVFAPNSESFIKHDALFPTFSICAC